VSGELGRGTLEMLLAQPLSRFAVICSQAMVTILGTAVIAASSWLGNWLGILTTYAKQEVTAAWHLPIPFPFVGSEIPVPFAEPKTVYIPMTELVDANLFWPAAVNLFAFGLMIAGFSSLMSAWDRYRWRTIGIVVGVYFLQSVAKLAGMAIEEVSWLRYVSAFNAYEPELAVRVADLTPEFAWSFSIIANDGSWQAYGPMTYHCIMAGLGLLFYGLAVWIFRRRDLPAPL
jgi:ABC-2 type transport system permease protein